MEYRFMNKNTEVFDFLYDEKTHTINKITNFINPNYAPIAILDDNSKISDKLFNNWWKNRAIPASRCKFKTVLKQMNIKTSLELLEKCFGLSLSDQYWIKDKTSPITWEKLNFFTNDFCEDMGKLLMGEIEYTDHLDIFSPDTACGGNLRKKWKIINGKRCLIKSGNTLNNQEPFNEVIAVRLYERILHKEEYVPYTLIEENGLTYSCCETMVNTNEEFVSASNMNGINKLHENDSLYEQYIRACSNLGIPDVKGKIDKMIVCDYILGNYDRQYNNFGAIRNIINLQWERIAPLFDSGSSLWATTPTQMVGAAYKSKPFLLNEEEQLHLVTDYSWLDRKSLLGFDNIVYSVLDKNPFFDDARKTAISYQVKQRINSVLDKQKMHQKRS